MEYKVEKSLREFEFWSGAKSNAQLLTGAELDTIEEGIIECSFDTMWSETDINDFMWFDTETIAEWLGYNSWQELFDERAK